MRALSVKQPWANLIASGRKSIEVRSWATTYRGPMIIASTQKCKLEPVGCTVALVTLEDCISLNKNDFDNCFPDHLQKDFHTRWYDGMIGWKLSDIKKLQPFPIKGQQGLYHIDYRCMGCGQYAENGKRVQWYEAKAKGEDPGLILIHETCKRPFLPMNPNNWQPFIDSGGPNCNLDNYGRLRGYEK